MSLEGKVAIVTGASRGIGAAIAKKLGKSGATVIGTATSENGASAITDYLKAEGISGQGYVLDVSDAESVQTFLESVSKDWSAPLILINNAGITKDNLLIRMSDDQWFDVINTNLNSMYRLSKGVLRSMMKARWGRIVNVASVVGSMGNAGQTNYAATKAGVAGFARSLAKEVGSRGITVNTVAPGFIDTDMTRALTDEQKAPMLAAIPLARLGEPEEIASVVDFLVSDGAAYVTGETLHVNGGMYMA
ncbi:3-oxoacyl-ACP reductase FabG [Sessilibacter sp. MAH4]